MLSKKTKYAIKALIHLARHHEAGHPVLIGDIASHEHIPKKFLENILAELKTAGILHSKKGKGGGYYLAKHPEEVHLARIIRLVNGPIALQPCISLNFYERCEECTDEEVCGLRDVLRQVRDATLSILINSTLAELVRKEDKLLAEKNARS